MCPLTVGLLLLFQAGDPSAEGLKALDAQKYDIAAQYFAKAVEADAKDYSAYFNLGLADSMLGRDAEAIAAYKKVLELKPGLYPAELNLGIVLLGAKRAPEALPYLTAAAGEKPKEYRPQLYLAQALLETGDLPKAEATYKAALEIDPKAGAAELGLAHALARQNRLADAEPHFRRAAESNPKFKDGLLELAGLYEKAGKTAEAIAIYQGFPDNVAVREHLGQMLVDAGRPEEGIPHLEWAVGQSATSANLLALAQAYRKNKQPEKELPVLERAMQAHPEDADLRLAYGRELRDQRRFQDAANQFAMVVRARPDGVDGWSEFAAMLVSLEKYPEAIAALDRIRALGGEKPGHLYLRAIVLDRVRDLKGALDNYQKFLAVSHDQFPNEEFKARQRSLILQRELEKR